MIKGIDGTQPGDPDRAAAAILRALDAEDAPRRLPLGDDAVDGILAHLDAGRADVLRWEGLSRSTGYDRDPRATRRLPHLVTPGATGRPVT